MARTALGDAGDVARAAIGESRGATRSSAAATRPTFDALLHGHRTPTTPHTIPSDTGATPPTRIGPTTGTVDELEGRLPDTHPGSGDDPAPTTPQSDSPTFTRPDEPVDGRVDAPTDTNENHQPGDPADTPPERRPPDGSESDGGRDAPVDERFSDEEFRALPDDKQYDVATKEWAGKGKDFSEAVDAASYGEKTWDIDDDSLTSESRTALRQYSNEPPASPTYVDFNGALRGEREMTPELQSGIDAIDQALRLKPLEEDLIVHRGTGYDHLTDDPFELVGESVSLDGFTSTSLGPVVFAHKPAVLHLVVPEGTPALYMGRISVYGGYERELLLARGLSYEVSRVVYSGDVYHIFGEFL